MNAEALIAIVALAFVVFGGIWGIVKTLLMRDRKTVEDQQKAMWQQLDKLRGELQEARLEQERIKERMSMSPDWEERIQAMEARLEKRFDDLMREFREFYAEAFKTFQQKQG
jgi:gas vesicle protein